MAEGALLSAREPRSPSHDDFDLYFVVHERWLRSHVRRAVADDLDVEEVCADVFASAWRKQANIGARDTKVQRAWLRRAVSYEVMHRRRGWARREAAFRRLAGAVEANRRLGVGWNVEDEAASLDDHRDALVRTVLTDLTPEERAVLELAAAGLRNPALAARLGVSPDAARTRLMRARREFRQRWSELGGSGEAVSP